MIKCLFLLLSCLTKPLIKNDYVDTNTFYNEYYYTLNEIEYNNDEVYNEYILKINENKKTLYYKDLELKEFSNHSTVKCLFNKEDFIVISIDYNIMNVVIYQGNIIVNEFSFESLFSFTFYTFLKDNKLYIIGEIIEYKDLMLLECRENKNEFGEIYNVSDLFIITYEKDDLINNYIQDDINIYGGKGIEVFYNALYYNNYIYIVGAKEQLSGGDFGNAGGTKGAIFLTKINLDLEIEKFICDYNQEVFEFRIIDEEIYLGLDSSIYVFDSDLNLVRSLKFAFPLRFVFIIDNHSFLTIDQTEVKIYDSLIMLEKDKFILNDDFDKVFRMNDSLIIRRDNTYYELDIYSLENFDDYIVYQNENIIDELRGTKINELIDYEVTPNNNFSLDGVYDVIYHFQGFDINGKIEVLSEVNVTEGVIYPVGYTLFFTGSAILDGKQIYCNHKVFDVGSHHLILSNLNGDIKEINFYISDSQIDFQEYANKNWDLEVLPNQRFYINLNIDKANIYNLETITINNEEIRDFIYNENEKLLQIYLKEDEPGIYKYRIEKVNFSVFGKKVSKYINKTYVVNVLYDTFNVNFNYDALSYTFDCILDDSNHNLRGILLWSLNGNIENEKLLNLNSQELILENINNNEKLEVVIYLLYSRGAKLEMIECLRINMNDQKSKNVKLGKLEIIKKGESLENFRIVLNHNNIEKINMVKEYTYQKNSDNYLVAIIIGLILAILSSLFIIFKKKIIRMKI